MNPFDPHIVSALMSAESARRCAVCGRGIRLDDQFGLAERICAVCLNRREPRGRVRTWLRRAA